MTTPSPLCEVNSTSLGAWTSTANGVNVALGEVVCVRLADNSGVVHWAFSCAASDELVVKPTLTVNVNAKTASFTAPSTPSTGWTLIFESTVGVSDIGLDASFQEQASFTTRFAIHSLSAAGFRLMAVGEEAEANAQFGLAPKMNAVIRNPPTIGVGGTPLTVATLAALRALAAPAQGTSVLVGSDPVPWSYDTASGAGFADDGETIVRPTAVLLASNGRWYRASTAPVLDTIAALRLAVAGKHKSIIVSAYSSFGDNGGGVFVYDSTDTTTADDGAMVIVAGTRRYKRVWDGVEVSAAWFGVHSGTHDSYATMQAFLNFCGNNATTNLANGQVGRIPRGLFLVSDQLVFQSAKGVRITGAGMNENVSGTAGTVIRWNGANDPSKAVLKTRWISNCTIEEFTVECFSYSTSNQAGMGVYLTSDGSTGANTNTCTCNTFKRVLTRSALGNGTTIKGAGFQIGNQTANMDVTVDANKLSECIAENCDSGFQVYGINTNQTSILDCHAQSNQWSVRMGKSTRGVKVDNILSNSATGAHFFQETLFYGYFVADGVTVELDSGNAPILANEAISGGFVATGTTSIRNVRASYPAGGTFNIVDYTGTGAIEFDNWMVAGGVSTTPKIWIHPSQAAPTRGPKTLTLGSMWTYDNVELDVDQSGPNAFAITGSYPAVTTTIDGTSRTIGNYRVSQGGNTQPTRRIENPIHLISSVQSDPALSAALRVTTALDGVLASHCLQFDIPYGQFAAGGAVATYDLYTANMPKRYMVRAVYALVQASGDRFRGGAISACTISVGVGSAVDLDGLLLDFDVFTNTITVGSSDQDYGAFANNAGRVAGGCVMSMTGTSQIGCRIKTTGANVSALTQGKLRLIIVGDTSE